MRATRRQGGHRPAIRSSARPATTALGGRAGGPLRAPHGLPLEVSSEVLAQVDHDASGARGRPSARVCPKTERDVVALVRWARRHHIPLVPRGAGTSLDGESVPRRGAVVVDLSRMDRILEVREEDLWARVEPGLVNYRLQEALRPKGLFYPPNPGSWESSTIGGNASTNASGFRSFRYGPTRAWVIRARAVLGTGEVVQVGTLSAKRSAGPDLLTSLLGSEGTFAIFTELTLRLVPTPARRVGLLAQVPEGVSLGHLAQGLQWARREGLSAVEWVDARVGAALLRGTGLPLREGRGALLLEVEVPREIADTVLERWSVALKGLGLPEEVGLFEDADQLWKARGKAGTLLDKEVGERVREDVAVPLSSWDRLIEGVQELAQRHEVGLLMYAHLGEGSLHPNFIVDPVSPLARRLRRELWELAWSLDGTASSEHGLGSLKAGAFVREHGPAAVRALRALKQSCDPDGILNPGKFWG
ncbi:MAG: FAD-binding oxidoreductase [Euryarchaeota archaeon]|nr:FAD-binding oxidoreductase [Euryarchaeota archaeon]MDE1835568.1 FAD-binding oxidoreductase [Euryarchaeota archaeon]MDE2043810.1 FAD-binding oxidoreductase [Thermoplasmata archaeon]